MAKTDPNVKKVLERLGLEKYIRHFDVAEVDYVAFLSIEDADLREMEIPVGPRIKILNEVEQLMKGVKASGKRIFSF